jgi:hypothetical protein
LRVQIKEEDVDEEEEVRVKTLNRLKVDKDDAVNAFASRECQRRVMFQK